MSTVRWRLYQIAGRPVRRKASAGGLIRHARQWVLKVAADLQDFSGLQQMRTAARSAGFL